MSLLDKSWRRTAAVSVGVVFLLIVLLLLWRQPVLAPIAQNAPGRSLPLAPAAPRETIVLAGGDIMLSRNVGAKIDEANDPTLPFQNIKTLLDSADLKFANLESPLSKSQLPIREGLVFRALTKYVPGLVWAGFNAVSTANNHALDQGTSGVPYTIDYLKTQNILTVGTGNDQSEAWAPAVLERNGIKFAFLAASYASANDNGKTRNDLVARIEDVEKLKTQISKLKTESKVVIVSMHAGIEYTRTPDQAQTAFARAAIDAGADAVIGHHPHWIQTIEIYKNKPIFYSLGNLVFDQMWSQDTREGLVVELKFQDKDLVSAKLSPVVIENYSTPRLATDQEKTGILKKINLASDTISFSSP